MLKLKTLLEATAPYRARLELQRLRRLGPQALQLSRALQSTLDGRTNDDEQRLIERIERLRRELSSSQVEIVKTDYGAGGSNSRRTVDEMARGVVTTTTVARACRASKSPLWALLLFKLVRELMPVKCLELGTCLGISAAYLASAQKLNGGGRVLTLEGDPALAGIAAKNLQQLALDDVEIVQGRFDTTLPAALEQLESVDYVFIDGHHDGRATLAYLEQIEPHLAEQSVVVFDDIAWPGMRRAWRQVAARSSVRIASNLGQLGVCLFSR